MVEKNYTHNKSFFRDLENRFFQPKLRFEKLKKVVSYFFSKFFFQKSYFYNFNVNSRLEDFQKIRFLTQKGFVFLGVPELEDVKSMKQPK